MHTIMCMIHASGVVKSNSSQKLVLISRLLAGNES